jgi:hypothetical protein
MITFQKTFFESAYETTCRLQNQAEEMNEMLFEKMPLMPEQGRKMIDESVAMGKKARDSYKKAVDDGFVRLEALFNTK